MTEKIVIVVNAIVLAFLLMISISSCVKSKAEVVPQMWKTSFSDGTYILTKEKPSTRIIKATVLHIGKNKYSPHYWMSVEEQ